VPPITLESDRKLTAPRVLAAPPRAVPAAASAACFGLSTAAPSGPRLLTDWRGTEGNQRCYRSRAGRPHSWRGAVASPGRARRVGWSSPPACGERGQHEQHQDSSRGGHQQAQGPPGQEVRPSSTTCIAAASNLQAWRQIGLGPMRRRASAPDAGCFTTHTGLAQPLPAASRLRCDHGRHSLAPGPSRSSSTTGACGCVTAGAGEGGAAWRQQGGEAGRRRSGHRPCKADPAVARSRQLGQSGGSPSCCEACGWR